MKKFLLPAAWLLAGVAVMMLGPGCASLPKVPDDLDCRFLGCPAGTVCANVDGKRVCLPVPPVDPPPVTPPPVTPPPVTPPPVTPPPPASFLPKPLADGAYAYMNDKTHGQGVDSTVRVYGDKEFCFLIHGVSVNDCNLEGWPNRALAEMELLKGCPVWQYRQDWDTTTRACLQVENDERRMSCDHFGSVEFRDDPITDAFEGRPEQCGAQRDPFGHPMAGFWIVAHGKGQVRACRPDLDRCGPWVEVDH